MSHENVDIVIDVVELIHELTDEDVGGEGEGEDEDEDEDEDVTPQQRKEESLKLLIESLVSHLMPTCSFRALTYLLYIFAV